MNSVEKPHWDADSSVSSVLRRFPVFRISKPFLSKFITRSRRGAATEQPARALSNPRYLIGDFSSEGLAIKAFIP